MIESLAGDALGDIRTTDGFGGAFTGPKRIPP